MTTQTLAPLPATPARGAGPVECCGGHRDRCVFGRPHAWVTWYRDGRLMRTSDTVQCWTCSGVCIGDEQCVDCGADQCDARGQWSPCEHYVTA